MPRFILSSGIVITLLLTSCNLPQTTIGDNAAIPVVEQTTIIPPHHDPDKPALSPTADAPHSLPAIRNQFEAYTVQPNDTLRAIAERYQITLDMMIEANDLSNPDILSIGQVLQIPPPLLAAPGSDYKIIPDSELVYGPYGNYFDLDAFINSQSGQLSIYHEEVNQEMVDGAQIIRMVSENHSVNPRLLLALLEYQSGWLTQEQSHLEQLSFPLGYADPSYSGLFAQLNWAANNLNRGYYLWRVNGLSAWVTNDEITIPASNTINAGTAALQYFFSLTSNEMEWRQHVSSDGFVATYRLLFGEPFEWAFEPLLPNNLTQPEMQLPFESNIAWTFTGGPHGGWDSGSAWAALDFAPPMEQLGCYPNNSWVVAMADGLVVRSEDGIVIQDLDGDGDPGTGWVLFYLHIESRDRVANGVFLQAGERIGHPSCEGGISSGTHLHIARRYNGEWIPADGTLPFVLDGWVSSGSGIAYEGTMQRDGQSIEACECQETEHTLQR